MNQYSSYLNLATGIITLGTLSFIHQPVKAQITPDNTLGNENSQVRSISQQEQVIEGGAIRDSNLFHSFSEFNVGENQTVNFANPDNIANIFSRVTGNNISQILGDLGVLGNANLFLINPNGIIFGENASLNVNGSFVATTANSINFADGNKFVANPATGTPLLTINQPTALEFANQPGTIINRAQSPQKATLNNQFNNLGSPAGLLVPSGNSLALIGGEVILEGGNLTATGGKIEVGSVGTNSLVGLSFTEAQIIFDYQAVNTFNDISLSNRDGFILSFPVEENGQLSFSESLVPSILDASTSTTVGSINLQGKNINILNGSQILTFTLNNLPGGNINLNATKKITVSDINPFTGVAPIPSGIISATNGNGDAGNINITASQLLVEETAIIASDATEGFNFTTGEIIFPEGNAGNIQINTTEAVKLTNQGRINSGTLGSGDGGIIKLTSANINLDRESLISTSTFQTGNAGNIQITTSESLSLNNGSQLLSTAEANSAGNAGAINLISPNIYLNNNSLVIAGTKGIGNGGAIKIIDNNSLTVTNESLLLTQVEEGAEGNAGAIKIFTDNFLLTNNSLVISDSKGLGNAGNISLEINDKLLAENNSIIRSGVEPTGNGQGGTITLKASEVLFNNESGLSSGTKGQGVAGNIDLIADYLVLDNVSFISSASNDDAVGNGGTIQLNTDEIIITNESGINAFTNTNSDAGQIKITTNNLRLTQGGTIFAATNGQGNAGDIQLNVTNSLIADGANPPSVPEIKPPQNIFLNEVIGKTGIFASSSNIAEGDGGNIIIGIFKQEGHNLTLEQNQYSNQIILENQAEISADSLGIGNGGSITIKSQEVKLNQGQISAITAFSQDSNQSLSNINLFVNSNLTLRNNSNISAEAQTNANGGNINITTDFLITSPQDNSDIRANADFGQGGNITIKALGVFGIFLQESITNFSDLLVSSNFGIDGNLSLLNLDIQLDKTESISNLELVKNVATFSPNYCDASRQNKYIQTGRGGIPLAATNTLVPEHTWEDWRIVSSEDATDTEYSTPVETNPTANYQVEEIAPVQGWLVNEQGAIVLTAEPIMVTPQPPKTNNPGC